MTDLRKAAQQALEALEQDNPAGRAATITALRAALAEEALQRLTDVSQEIEAALAEPVQEPVAWMVYTEGGTSAYVTDNPNDLVGAYRALALYTAPPQRKPLTEEEIGRVWHDNGAGIKLSRFSSIARAVERAHGIKE